MATAADLTARVDASRVRIIAPTGEGTLLPVDARGQIMLWAALLLGSEAGLAELAPGRRDAAGRLHVRRVRDPRRYPHASEPLELADRALALAGDGNEVFCGPLPHVVALPGSAGVTGGRVLWVDLDDRRALSRLVTFDPRPCLIVSTGGAPGRAHGYWRLSRRLPGQALEAANAQLARRLDGDPAVKDRGRLMRLPGTRNGKTGEPCRLLLADLQPIRHEPAALLGPDSAPQAPPVALAAPRRIAGLPDPLRDVAPATYFRALCGVEPGRSGLVRCPLPDHEDRTPSCRVYPSAEQGWWCFGCTRGGRVYDLASLLLGGPWGRDLRGEPFRRARALVHERLGVAPRR
jgi:hypothetical protein